MPEVFEGLFEGSEGAGRPIGRDLQKTKAGSSGQCITAVQEVSVELCRSAVVMGLAGTAVELVGDGVQVGLAERAESPCAMVKNR